MARIIVDHQKINLADNRRKNSNNWKKQLPDVSDETINIEEELEEYYK